MSKLVVLIGSVRKNGNTDRLAKAFVDGAKLHNKVTVISVADYLIRPCVGCNACVREENQPCVQKDDMQKIYPVLAEADIIVAASPVYFYGISAQLKALVDRLHTPMRNTFRVKKLGLLLVAASPLPTVFDSIHVQYRLILDYFKLDSIGSVLVQEVREKGDIQNHPALQEAYELGKSIQ
ncbi:MAG: flavodoxin family protein [Eubacteriales bacterium]|nr:flavodoxin family protein [Eubacteriales bacterium]